MSFGFSIGDFVAVGSLIVDIVNSLREAGGSKSEYQEILRELEGLQHALSYLDKLQSSDASPTSIDSIKFAALSCRRPLEQFLDKIKKYDNALGVWSKAGTARGATHKLKWAYAQKDEIRKLQTYLNVHVATINILLAEHGLERMDIASERCERDRLQVRERLETTQKLIERINSSTQSQAQAMKVTSSMLGKLFQMISGEVMTSLKSLVGMVSKVCVSTQQIYTIVLDIKRTIDPGDTKWTYFQAPLIVEDALGFKFPVPSEYDYDLLDAIIKHRFLDGPGSLDVTLGNYELFHARGSTEVISPQVRLLPGTSITMAILLGKTELSDQECPMPRCKSNRITLARGGGQICCECNVFFDKSNKKRRSLQDLLDGISDQSNEVRPGKRKSDIGHDARKRLKTSRIEDDMHSFRNVRWTIEPVHLKDTRNSPDELGAPTVSSNIGYAIEHSESGDGVGTRPVLDDALNYLDLLKVEFHDQPETYNLCLDVMKAFKEGILDTQGVIDHVAHLLEGKVALLEGFNLFLPPGYRMPLDSHSDPNFSWSIEIYHTKGNESNSHGLDQGMKDRIDGPEPEPES